MNRNVKNYGSIVDSSEVGFSGTAIMNASRDFNSLCDEIATNVYTINSSIKTLHDNLKLIGTPRDNAEIRNKIHVTQSTTNEIASVTTRNIHKLKILIPKNDKQKSLQVDKIEENFKETVSNYYKLQKELADKQKSNLLLTAQVEHPPSDDEENSEEQKQMQLSRELQFEQEMLIEREERVRQIEADVLDINQIMRELGSVVHDQGERIDSIENSIDHAAGNVEEGNEQLIKASRYQTSYRKKLLILVIIATIIAIILITVIVIETKKT